MALTNGIYKGKGLSLEIDAVEYNMDVRNVTLTSEEKEVITFADLSTGARQWTLTVTAMFDAATGSLWRYVWDNAGTDDVAFTIQPWGNAVASASQPHITGTLSIPNKPDFPVDANSASEVEFSFEVDGEPTLVVV